MSERTARIDRFHPVAVRSGREIREARGNSAATRCQALRHLVEAIATRKNPRHRLAASQVQALEPESNSLKVLRLRSASPRPAAFSEVFRFGRSGRRSAPGSPRGSAVPGSGDQPVLPADRLFVVESSALRRSPLRGRRLNGTCVVGGKWAEWPGKTALLHGVLSFPPLPPRQHRRSWPFPIGCRGTPIGGEGKMCARTDVTYPV